MNRISFLLLISFTVIDSQDPCSTTNILTDPKRSILYSLGSSEKEQCDRVFTAGWYKIKDDGIIAQTCPEPLRCGATFGAWINGTLPSRVNETAQVISCHKGFTDCCETQQPIDVKNCGSFHVFNLPALSSCPGRYCTAGKKARIPCSPGFSSDDGFEPCSRISIVFNTKPTVLPYIPTFVHDAADRGLTFECQIPNTFENRKYLYDIKWIIDKTIVAEKKMVAFINLKSVGSLYTKDWNPTMSLGFMVQCDIRARENPHSTPSLYVTSPEFYAGVKIQQSEVDIQAGQSVVVKVMPTVPIACYQLPNRLLCDVMLELFSLEDQMERTGGSCNQSITNDIKGSNCGITFDGRQWNQWHSLTVTTQTDKTSRAFYTASVKLRAISKFDSFWKDFHLPEVKIRVFAKTMNKGLCRSYDDPHIKTFDGTSTRVTHVAGEFYLYNHTTKPLEIHTIHKWRPKHSYEANCAIAIRAASDIFIIYGCDDPVQWMIRRLNCDRDRQVLEVYSRNQGSEYEIILPTGTQVKVNIMSEWLKIYVFASPTDYGFTEGLCGTYNGIQHDDWKMRNGGSASSFDEFVKSWSVPQAESLFIRKSRNEVLQTAVLYCSCKEDLFATGLTQKAECAWKDSLPLCKGLNWKQDLCQIGTRNRRDSTRDDIEIDASPDIVTYAETPLTNPVWRNGWTEQKARAKCEHLVKSSPMFGICSSLDNVKVDPVIDSCVDDIKTTGSDMFMKSSFDTISAQCSYEVQTNTSLWSSTGSGNKSIKEIFLEQDCPNNCSGIATCTNGACHCPNGYTSDDCSVKIDSIPEVTRMSANSLCDLNKRLCDTMAIFGKGFYNSQNIMCSITSAELNQSTLVPGTSSKTVTGDLISFGEVACSVPSSRRRRRSVLAPGMTNAYLISVTMNGRNYSQAVPMVVFDSACTDCTFLNGGFVCNIRKDIIVRNGACYDNSDNGQKMGNDSMVANNLWIIGAVLGGLAMCIVGIIVIIKVFSKKRQTAPSLPDIKQYAQ